MPTQRSSLALPRGATTVTRRARAGSRPGDGRRRRAPGDLAGGRIRHGVGAGVVGGGPPGRRPRRPWAAAPGRHRRRPRRLAGRSPRPRRRGPPRAAGRRPAAHRLRRRGARPGPVAGGGTGRRWWPSSSTPSPTPSSAPAPRRWRPATTPSPRPSATPPPPSRPLRPARRSDPGRGVPDAPAAVSPPGFHDGVDVEAWRSWLEAAAGSPDSAGIALRLVPPARRRRALRGDAAAAEPARPQPGRRPLPTCGRRPPPSSPASVPTPTPSCCSACGGAPGCGRRSAGCSTRPVPTSWTSTTTRSATCSGRWSTTWPAPASRCSGRRSCWRRWSCGPSWRPPQPTAVAGGRVHPRDHGRAAVGGRRSTASRSPPTSWPTLAEAKRPMVRLRGRWVRADPARLARLGDPALDRGRRGAGGRAGRRARRRRRGRSRPPVVVGPLADLADRLRAVADRGRQRATPTAETLRMPAGLRGRAPPLPGAGPARGWRPWPTSASGGVLADDMGLGKTVQLLALHLPARRGRRRPARPRGLPGLAARQLGAGGRALHARACRCAASTASGRHLDDLGRRRARAGHLRHRAPRTPRRWPPSSGGWSSPTRPRR